MYTTFNFQFVLDSHSLWAVVGPELLPQIPDWKGVRNQDFVKMQSNMSPLNKLTFIPKMFLNLPRPEKDEKMLQKLH